MDEWFAMMSSGTPHIFKEREDWYRLLAYRRAVKARFYSDDLRTYPNQAEGPG
jgi:hypothetical protein